MTDASHGWLHPRARRPAFLIKAFVIGLVMLLAVGWFANRYQVGVSDEEVQSLRYTWFLIDTKDHSLGVGEYVVFRIGGNLPPWPAGTQFVKKVVAVPGDEVVVSEHATRVNGADVAGPLDLLVRLEKPASVFEREEVVRENTLFVVGENARSYDSRYWGLVSRSQIVGRGYPIW